MAWTSYADELAKLNAAIDARLVGGLVESYTLPNGMNIRTTPTDQLLTYRKELAAMAAQTKPYGLARLQPLT